MKKLGLFVAALLLGGALAQDALLGDWGGAIGPDSLNLGVTVHFTQGSDGLSGTIDIPAQGAQGLELAIADASDEGARFTIQGVPGDATFDGSLSGDTLSGTFSQSGQTIPFALSRVQEAATGGATGGAREVTGNATGGAVTGGVATGGAATGGAVTGGTGGATTGDTGGVSGGAAGLSPKGALERLFTDRPLQPEWFEENFLSAVPVSQLMALSDDLTQQLGTYESVEGDSSPFTVRFSQGTATARVILNAQGRINTLFFSNYTPNISINEAVTRIAALPGQTNMLVLKNGEEIAAHNADTPLGVGSAFKLAVLAALQDQIEAGTYTWDEVVELKPEWKSLPSGILQDWPDNAPLTLQTLATLMISISDNTATDALIHIVGREAVEAKAERNRPFLTTQELFKLKDPQNSDLLEPYLAGDEAAKRAVLTQVADRPPPNVEAFTGDPVALEAEWFFTPAELCALMGEVQALPLMSVNSGGLANPADWGRIAFKGGSEPGVLNLTMWLDGKDGATYCVTVTQNNGDASLDEEGLFTLYTGLLGALE